MSADPSAEVRAAIVAEAVSWLNTPYVSNGLVKGAGTDCAMLLIGVYGNCGLIPKEFDPRPYPAQWHLHRNVEQYMAHVLNFADEVPGPPDRAPLPGDMVMFKLGRVFSHGGIITSWPNIIHAVGDAKVMREDVSKCRTGKRAFWFAEKRFFCVKSLIKVTA